MLSFSPLMSTMHKKKVSKTELQSLIKVSSATIAKISKDEYVSMKIIDDICKVLECNVEDVILYIEEDKKDSE
jgi:putative transcriptional regulator